MRRELPYHISALYVVDLAVFRKGAVGDQLRSIYDQLSRDPNSLSNLDQVCACVRRWRGCFARFGNVCACACVQDLPNYAQHAVPIFSLPQEWLWCVRIVVSCTIAQRVRARVLFKMSVCVLVLRVTVVVAVMSACLRTGASLGAAMTPRRRLRRLTCATIHCTRCAGCDIVSSHVIATFDCAGAQARHGAARDQRPLVSTELD